MKVDIIICNDFDYATAMQDYKRKTKIFLDKGWKLKGGHNVCKVSNQDGDNYWSVSQIIIKRSSFWELLKGIKKR